MLLAHHEILIAVEYSLFAGGGVIYAVSSWWRKHRPTGSTATDTQPAHHDSDTAPKDVEAAALSGHSRSKTL